MNALVAQPGVECVAAILRGEHVAPIADEAAAAQLIGAASTHGVLPLLCSRLHERGVDEWAAAVRSAVRREPALGAALELLRRQELIEVLDALAAGGVRPILLKGASLAYTLYPDPSLRPSFDVDLLVRRGDIEAAGEVLRARGYARPRQVTGELVMHQLDYARRDGHGVWHVFDLHWKLANRQAVADMLSYDELDRDARAIPALGVHARGPHAVHALMLACVHRLVHHPSDERLVWLYDIHLLTESLTADDAPAFASLAGSRSVSAICADGLETASRVLGTRVPDDVLETLARGAADGTTEPSAAFLRRRENRIDEILSDLRALPGWSKRLRLVREHAFPPSSYMTGAYMVSSRAWLPALYTHRIVRGAWRWLRKGVR